MKKNPLLDEEFLNKLERERNRELFARITALDLNELPVEYIEGKVIGGSLNIDGSSCLRRTCQLQLVADEMALTDYYWGLKCKFILEIGLRNDVDPQYEDIIWFKQGVYVIVQFSSSLGVGNMSVSISGKDKMCLLNGDLAGNIMNISEDFGTYWEWGDEEHTTFVQREIPIYETIYKGVQTYAGELPQNITINDLAECGLKMMDYKGKDPIYLTKNVETQNYENLYLSKSSVPSMKDDNGNSIGLDEIKYETEIRDFVDLNENATQVTFGDGKNKYVINEIKQNTTVAYKLTELVYAGELIANAGDTFTSVLDKIVDMLGNYEYFYDIDGKFVFQKKKNYLTGNWTGLKDFNTRTQGTSYLENAVNDETFSYIFDDNYLLNSINVNPDLANVRNDFTVWGKRDVNGSEFSFHYRCAIDEKPVYYNSPWQGKTYISNIMNNGKDEIKEDKVYCDWREIIYQMAWDYQRNNVIDSRYKIFELWKEANQTKAATQEEEEQAYNNFKLKYDFYTLLRDSNRVKESDVIIGGSNQEILLYPNGRTGYERYYTDMEAFWRLLYCIPETVQANTEGKEPDPKVSEYYMVADGEEDAIKAYFLDAVDTKDISENSYCYVEGEQETIYSPYDSNKDYLLKKSVVDLSKYDKKKLYSKSEEAPDEYSLSEKITIDEQLFGYSGNKKIEGYKIPGSVEITNDYYTLHEYDNTMQKEFEKNISPLYIKQPVYKIKTDDMADTTLYKKIIENNVYYYEVKIKSQHDFDLYDKLYIRDRTIEKSEGSETEQHVYTMREDLYIPFDKETHIYMESGYVFYEPDMQISGYEEVETYEDGINQYYCKIGQDTTTKYLEVDLNSVDEFFKYKDSQENVKLYKLLYEQNGYKKSEITYDGNESSYENCYFRADEYYNHLVNNSEYIKNEDEKFPGVLEQVQQIKTNLENQLFIYKENKVPEEGEYVAIEAEDLEKAEASYYGQSDKYFIRIYEEVEKYEEASDGNYYVDEASSIYTRAKEYDKDAEYYIDSLIDNGKYLVKVEVPSYDYLTRRADRILVQDKNEPYTPAEEYINNMPYYYSDGAGSYKSLSIDKATFDNNIAEGNAIIYIVNAIEVDLEKINEDNFKNYNYYQEVQNAYSKVKEKVEVEDEEDFYSSYGLTLYKRSPEGRYSKVSQWGDLKFEDSIVKLYAKHKRRVDLIYADVEDNKIATELSTAATYNSYLKIGNDENVLKGYEIEDDGVATKDIIKELYYNDSGYVVKSPLINKFPKKINSEWYEIVDGEKVGPLNIFKFRDGYKYYSSPIGPVINGERSSWTDAVLYNPELLTFWLDFIESGDSDFAKYSVKAIGPRPKVINEDSIKAIYYREVPNILLEDENSPKYNYLPGYVYINLPDETQKLFSLSSQGVSAKDKMDQLLNNNTYIAEQVSLTSIPIYRLDANTRILVQSKETNISGEYLVDKISIPLNYNGTINITAVKAFDNIY